MPLRVGVVGFGEIAQYHVRHLTAAGARVCGAVTTRPTPHGLERYPSLEAMAPHVDAVTIAVPNHLHASSTCQALATGKAVFCEKPLAIRPSQLDAVAETLESADAVLHVGFRLRWNPTLRALRERLRGVRRVRCVYRISLDRLAREKSWTRRSQESGGTFFTVGVHALDLARWIGGAHAEPLVLAGASQKTLPESGEMADFPLEAYVRGWLPGGVEIEAGGDLSGSHPFRLHLDVEADDGHQPDQSVAGPAPEDPGAADAEYSAMMTAFVRAAERALRDRDAEREYLQVHRDLFEAQRAAAVG